MGIITMILEVFEVAMHKKSESEQKVIAGYFRMMAHASRHLPTPDDAEAEQSACL